MVAQTHHTHAPSANKPCAQRSTGMDNGARRAMRRRDGLPRPSGDPVRAMPRETDSRLACLRPLPQQDNLFSFRVC